MPGVGLLLHLQRGRGHPEGSRGGARGRGDRVRNALHIVVYISCPGRYQPVIVRDRMVLAFKCDTLEFCDGNTPVPSVAAAGPFMLYKGGIFAGCTSQEPDHAITVRS